MKINETFMKIYEIPLTFNGSGGLSTHNYSHPNPIFAPKPNFCTQIQLGAKITPNWVQKSINFEPNWVQKLRPIGFRIMHPIGFKIY